MATEVSATLPFVIPSEADLSRRAVEGPAVRLSQTQLRKYAPPSTGQVEMFFDLRFNTLLENIRRYPHAQLNRSRGLRQGANRNEIHSGKCIFADIFERDDAPRGLEWDGKTASAHDADGLLGLGRRHVVQQQRLRAAVQGLLQLRQIANLALHCLAGRARRKGAGQNLGNAAAKPDVIALDQNAVGKIEPMALATAATRQRICPARARPGTVLRVSNILALVPATASTYSRVQVEMPLIRCIKFRMTRSQARMTRALLRITATA